ncbi:MAG: ABC transporter ATP-binding protein [Deltaproteobacteria bacterium]|nr:ABC transporter ATP-binding protein [Deltaproteobacteria bacterium]
MSIQAQNLSFAYPGTGAKVLNDISFILKSSSLGVIMGPNGSGKSTLLKTINRLVAPQSGTIFLDGQDYRNLSRREIAQHCGYMPQKSPAVHCTVFEAVLLGHKALNPERRQAGSGLQEVEKILKLIHLDKLADRFTHQLSGGELQKVVIARALVRRPQILLLDEPTNHLDLVNQLEVMSLLQKITHELKLTTVVVTHDLNSALRFADTFLLLKEGRLHTAGAKNIITPQVIAEVFSLKSVIAEVAGFPVMVPLAPSLP